jgi:Spy/CpxP family protein refolding chaperone
MRSRIVGLASALVMALAIVAVAAEPADKQAGKDAKPADQPNPGGNRGGRGGFRGGRGLTVDQIVERLMSFDKNNDGKLTKDELPERMQDLIAKGDTNKDGVLDKDEVKALAAKLQQEGLPRGFGGNGGFARFGGFRGGFGPGGAAERALGELKLTDKKKEAAEAAVKAHQEDVKKLMELARADLLLKMKDILTAEEYKKFKDGLENPPGAGPRGR